MFYKQKSEYTTRVETYLRDLTRIHDVREQDITIVDPDSPGGALQAEVYGIMAYPGLVVTDQYGQFIHSWSGELPLMDELMSYVFTLE